MTRNNNDARNWLTLLIVAIVSVAAFLTVSPVFGFVAALALQIFFIIPVGVLIAGKLTGRHLMRELFGAGI